MKIGVVRLKSVSVVFFVSGGEVEVIMIVKIKVVIFILMIEGVKKLLFVYKGMKMF